MQQKPQVTKNNADKSILIAPSNPKNSLIWLHGLGDSSEGFEDYFLEENSPVYEGTRVLLLQAPNRPVTLNGGKPCNSWYDIKVIGPQKQEDRISLDNVRTSAETIQAAVDLETNFWNTQNTKIPAHRRIFVGGFSQGSSMTLYYGLRCLKPILGLIGFSGLLLQSAEIKNLGPTKALVYHGAADQVIPLKLAQASYQRENFAQNQNVKLKIVPDLTHSVTAQQRAEIKDWILSRFRQEEQSTK